MNTCLTFNGEKFSSDMELDSHLFNNFYDKVVVKDEDLSYSVDLQQTTLDKLREIESKVPKSKLVKIAVDEGEYETSSSDMSCPGVTKFVNTWGDPNDLSKAIVPPFDEEAYLNKLKIDFENAKNSNKPELLNLTKEQLNQFDNFEVYKTTLKESWKVLTDIGTDFHSLFEVVLQHGVDISSWNPVKGKNFYSSNVVNRMVGEFRGLIQDIQREYPGCTIMTEIPIVSKHINELYDKAGVSAINGRIDLLVVDKNGIAHIYDLKVSKKSVGKWKNMLNDPLFWHSTKKLNAEYQVSFYKAILEQYGIQCSSPKIIPIKIDPEFDQNNGVTINSITNSKIDQIQKNITTSERTAIVKKIIPDTQTLTTNLETVNQNLLKAFPNYQIVRKVKNQEVTVDYYRKNSKFITEYTKTQMESDPSIKGRFKFRDKFRKGDRVVWCDTEDELIENLTAYVQKVNESIDSEIGFIINQLELACVQGEEFDDSNLIGDSRYDNAKLEYCKRIFRKYYSKAGQWVLEKNGDLFAAGILVFRKKGTNVIDIVSITNTPINETVNLEKGTSILGHSTADYNVDFHDIYRSTNGNIDVMKVLAVLNESSLMKEDSVINNISVHNIWRREGLTTYPTHAFSNWKTLCDKYKIDLKLKHNQFASVANSAMTYVCELLNDVRNESIYDWTVQYSQDTVITASIKIIEMIEELKGLNEAGSLKIALEDKSGKSWNFDDPYQKAYALLHQALLDLHGHKVFIEKDPENWFKLSFGKKGEVYAGLNITAPGNSPSMNIQTLSKIFSVMGAHIRRKELSYRPKYATATKNLYDYNGRNSATGGEIKYFDNLFERDENGNIKKQFRLRDPNDPGLSKEESEFIKTFLNIVNSFRYPTEFELERAIENDTWRDVPLRRGSFKSHVHNNSFKEGVKLEYEEVLNALRIFDEQEGELNKSRSEQRPYNKYNISEDTRDMLIDKYGPKYFETHLEDLLLDVIHSYIVEETSNEYLPQLQGIKLVLMYNQGMYGQLSDNVVEYIDKYIDINIYNQTIIKGPSMQRVHKMMSTIQRVTTATTLGFNFRSGLRELLQGTWINLSRTMAEAYGRDQFTKGEIAKAWGIVFKDMIKDVNLLTLVDAMNVEYGMANAGIDEIQKFLSQSKSGAKNFDSDKLFFANRIPDTFHRMGILIAKMLHDGCWEAHEMVEDQLVYNFKKDKRFNLLNESNVDKTSKEYKHQHALYETMRMQFNKEGFNIKSGEDLPRAYTVQEGQSVKAFSEMCFGHYDKNTQMLVKKMALGSVILQFRTFLSAKLEQWSLKPGTYDQGQYEEKVNEEGIRYVRIISEDENGIPSVTDIKLETELKGDEIWEPVIEWKGRFMEGILYSMASFGKKLLKLDWEGLKELWKVPAKRANFKLFLHDMVWMSILMAIMRALIIENDEVEMGPIEHFGATALYTSFADGPITSIITSMFGDLNPPMYKIIKNYYNQLGGLVTGRKDFGDAMVGTFGALADLKYLNITD